ncbi:hypothetical protein GO755_38520 [Spirosoma sp. HMF4905]|uniref:YD repeat-containing protein n=1 Tax=Spirosoma arboris TaxID=2682092 RepID=A0A7K1SQ94_9BACT|nr:hypothetical protein [Spirosoma arboris]MVM35972.1 hypothetical protein [Spirosoma arboris]
MKLKLSIWICFFSIPVLFFACQRPDNPVVQQKFRIKKVTKFYPKSGSLPVETIYTYNRNGWIDSAVSHTTDGIPAPVTVGFLYDYDQKGRVIKATTNTGSNKYILYFDTTGRLSAKYAYISVPGYESLTQEDHLTYSNSTDPVPIRMLSLSGRLGMARDSTIQEYTYQGGNIVQQKVRIRTQTTTYDKSNSVATYQYDDKPNPFYRFLFGYYLDPDWKTFSKNNVLNDSEINTYDSNGLLVKVTQRNGGYEFIYEYEAY